LIEREETQKESEKAGTSRSAITEAVLVPESLGKCANNDCGEGEVHENLTEINVAALNIHVAANEYMSDEKSILSAKADTVCEDNSAKVDILAASAGEMGKEKYHQFEKVYALVASAGENEMEKC
jgi:hypothetical protein